MKQKKILKTRLFIVSLCSNFLLFSSVLIARVYETDSINKISQHINVPHTLVVFDIDNTLIATEDDVASPQWFDFKLKQLKNQGLSQLEALQKILPEHLTAHTTTQVYPIEKETVTLINALQKKGIHPLALTARSYIDITHRQLKAARINLATQSQWQNICYVFDNFPKPVYYTPGILFANGNDKGTVLETFLKQLKYRPHKIIFVDDQLKHVLSVEKMAKRMGFKKQNFVGIRYSKLDPKVEAFNKKMAPTASTSQRT